MITRLQNSMILFVVIPEKVEYKDKQVHTALAAALCTIIWGLHVERDTYGWQRASRRVHTISVPLE